MTTFVLKRYEICLDVQLSLNPMFFNENNWPKRKFVSEIAPLMPQMQALIASSAIVENVTFQAFNFATEQERQNFMQLTERWQREFDFLCRRVQASNDSVNLFFDLEETLEDGASIAPDINDIKRSKFNPRLGANSLAQHSDLLANALTLQFPG